MNIFRRIIEQIEKKKFRKRLKKVRENIAAIQYFSEFSKLNKKIFDLEFVKSDVYKIFVQKKLELNILEICSENAAIKDLIFGNGELFIQTCLKYKISPVELVGIREIKIFFVKEYKI